MNRIIEYVWDRPKRTKITDKSGNEIVKINMHRQKKGVMLAFINPDTDMVFIGVSLCCNLDKFDYKDGTKENGFGLSIAKERAIKHASTEYIKIHGITTIPRDIRDQGDENGVWIPEVKIPASIIDDLKSFINRCQKYYKDKKFPDWVNIIMDNSVIIDLKNEIRAKDISENNYFEAYPECNFGEFPEHLD